VSSSDSSKAKQAPVYDDVKLSESDEDWKKQTKILLI
jgi:hypothetical protein